MYLLAKFCFVKTVKTVFFSYNDMLTKVTQCFSVPKQISQELMVCEYNNICAQTINTLKQRHSLHTVIHLRILLLKTSIQYSLLTTCVIIFTIIAKLSLNSKLWRSVASSSNFAIVAPVTYVCVGTLLLLNANMPTWRRSRWWFGGQILSNQVQTLYAVWSGHAQNVL